MKKILPVAVLAALAGVNGAQAVHVNPDGLGQVLVYPFYTTEATQDTYINLVNTTNEYKAVKIRILESMNSREVLDFNIYMSPHDHWSATITADGPTGPGTLTSRDTTCTVPLSVARVEGEDAGATIPFRTLEFDGTFGSGADDSVKTPERTREGYVEVIEMGIVTDPELQALIEHQDGYPPGCATIAQRWNDPAGAWFQDQTDGMSGVTGGLYGYGVLIDVLRGSAALYDAVSLDNWVNPAIPTGIIHTDPGSVAPSIGNGSPFYDVFDGGGVVSGEADSGWDAVSLTMMHSSMSNDYVLEPSVLGATDWVVTFPTKREYVNQDPVLAPFTAAWDSSTSTACETFDISYWDREEGSPSTPPTDNDFSPRPPPNVIDPFNFCFEANVLSFNGETVLSASDRTGVNLELEEGFDNGWGRVNFVVSGAGLRELSDLDGNTFEGLPAIGFAVQRYQNNDVAGDICDDLVTTPEDPIEACEGTIRANYSGTVTHKADRLIVAPGT